MGSKSSSTNSADGEFAAALKATQFFLVYQPTIDLETNAFAGVEALIRWRHPSRGVLSPVDFIEELEDSGAIVSVGRWAMQTACSDGASWHDKGYRFNVSVNVSPRQFSDPGFIDDVSKALDVSRFDPALFVLEFAQGTLAGDRDAARERISLLRKVGVRIAIDDFGPRESALDEVEEFEIDIVKLERAFVSTLAHSAESAALVHKLVQLSDSRHIQVIAAGIEDSNQRERLQSERVHVGQGFLFSKPHEAREIDRYLEDFAIFSGKPL